MTVNPQLPSENPLPDGTQRPDIVAPQHDPDPITPDNEQEPEDEEREQDPASSGDESEDKPVR